MLKNGAIRLCGLFLSLCVAFSLSACSNDPGNSNVTIANNTVPLAGLPEGADSVPDTPAADESTPELSEPERQILTDNAEITSTLKSDREASEEEILAAARDVIAMYETGEFKGDDLNATRYPLMPEGCSVEQIGELSIEENFYLYPYGVTADVGGGTQMIMGIEYVKGKDATDERPEGWRVAAVLFRQPQ